MKSKYLPFEILYEDRDLIVIDKPAGLLTTNTRLVGRAAREAQPTAENFLNAYVRKGQLRSSKRVYLVHRLDRETSGVMMFVKDERLADAIRDRWNELTEKTYVATVEGALDADEGVFESYLQEDADGYRVRSVAKGGKLARTEWRKISMRRDKSVSPPVGAEDFSLRRDKSVSPPNEGAPQRGRGTLASPQQKTTTVEVALKSGRKNQIRVHFSEAGHPVVGDVKYGAKKADRLYLRSVKLVFTHPFTGKRLEFAAP